MLLSKAKFLSTTSKKKKKKVEEKYKEEEDEKNGEKKGKKKARKKIECQVPKLTSVKKKKWRREELLQP